MSGWPILSVVVQSNPLARESSPSVTQYLIAPRHLPPVNEVHAGVKGCANYPRTQFRVQMLPGSAKTSHDNPICGQHKPDCRVWRQQIHKQLSVLKELMANDTWVKQRPLVRMHVNELGMENTVKVKIHDR